MQVLLDTNTFQKLFGYYRYGRNADKIVDVEKLYNEIILGDRYDVNIPVFCIYEIFTKSEYKDKLIQILGFLKENNIKVLNLKEGKQEKFEYEFLEIFEINVEKTLDNIKNEKVRYERFELMENIRYLIFIIKSLIIDNLKIKFLKQTLVLKDVDLKINSLYDDNREYYEKIINIVISKTLKNGYENICNVKKYIKNLFMQIIEKFVKETYEILLNYNAFLEKIVKEELCAINRLTNKFEYLKNQIQLIEKELNINYLDRPNNNYKEQLKHLHWPIDYINYLVGIYEKQLYKAKFDKNDFIDSSLFLFYKEDSYLLSFENNILQYLRKNHCDNEIFIKKFLKTQN